MDEECAAIGLVVHRLKVEKKGNTLVKFSSSHVQGPDNTTYFAAATSLSVTGQRELIVYFTNDDLYHQYGLS